MLTLNNDKTVCFIDLEIQEQTQKIVAYGGVDKDGFSLQMERLDDLYQHINSTDFVSGHNILNHDLKYLEQYNPSYKIDSNKVIDTLYWSALLFPSKPYHQLIKDDKLYEDNFNNPVNDAIKAKHLFLDEVETFIKLTDNWQQILINLLDKYPEYNGFFNYINIFKKEINLNEVIQHTFKHLICDAVDLQTSINNHPIALAYALAYVQSFKGIEMNHSFIPKWVVKNYPEVEQIVFKIRNTPCLDGCDYCADKFDAQKGLQRFFGYENYRTYNNKPLQEFAVKAAVLNKSVLAVFPTGGGKSITFQVPALMAGQTLNALTVVISPLQSLMKDQIDNLEKQNITNAVTINGLLDPIERAKSMERVENGTANLLYISPESLRSKTIEYLLLSRNVVRFVIDEAHCLSAWGQDFRVDYLYIADFIKNLQEKKNLVEPIPVSCFTATAKLNVINDILKYFKDKLGLKLELFTASAARTNLMYKVFKKENDDDKYLALRDLIEQKQCSTIVYVSRTKKAMQLAERLASDGFNAKAFHGKMDKYEKNENQNAFINGDIQIMVATSAFGMGVDKKDVQLVVHFEISDSLENYVQEAGRAGRDENIAAECFVLYNEDDLNKHFILLNQTKLSIKEVQQIWKAIKDITRYKKTISNSALEIARAAGWDDSVVEIETRVRTAISALEEAGYLKRKQNSNRIYANSILTKNAQIAIDKIHDSTLFLPQQKENAIRIIKKLFSTRSKAKSKQDATESRVDYISDHLGIVKQEVIDIIQLLRQENILADTKDLTAYITKNENQTLNLVKNYGNLEKFLLELIPAEIQEISLKQWNELAEEANLKQVTTKKIKSILNFWTIKNWMIQKSHYNKNNIHIQCKLDSDELKQKLDIRIDLAEFIINYLFLKKSEPQNESNKNYQLIHFSILELKVAYEKQTNLFKKKISLADIEDTLFYLSRIEALKIEGGFMVIHNKLTIERLEKNNKKQYTKDDYQKLQHFYENKIQQIHIVGEYAKQMLVDYKNALEFVSDYFELNYSSFLSKYFKGNRQNEISKNITPTKFKQLFGELSPTQLKIINDKENQNIVVAAGPGSGKTKLLAHKLASLLLMEDVKHEHLLMLTFSRAAASEFKKRLHQLIGNAVHYVDIKTFHSYCFDILGKVGNLNKTSTIIPNTVALIQQNEVEINRITKSVLVIDEAQDMDENDFALVMALLEQNEEMRLIAVGDDDQNIYEFRGSDSKFLQQLIHKHNAIKYELLTNYRSQKNLVELSNTFVKHISNRLKTNPILPYKQEIGTINCTMYTASNLLKPVIKNIKETPLKGTTCVLTNTNEEAFQLTGLLSHLNIKARLIQSNEGFNLFQLDELRYFYSCLNLNETSFIIQQEQWNTAKRAFFVKYKNTLNYNICVQILKGFQEINTKIKYVSDFKNYIEESKLEDFFEDDSDVILVSTIHKTKGKEFDNVFLMLQHIDLQKEATKRMVYVALTRAKNNLYIHTNNLNLEELITSKIEIHKNYENFSTPRLITLNLGFKEVWLSYFKNNQTVISNLKSGDTLIAKNEIVYTIDGKEVLKFSRLFFSKLYELKSKNYEITSVSCNFILYWYDDKSDSEIKIILPKITLEQKK